MARLVDRYSEIGNNVGQFNKDMRDGADIVTQLSQFRHWYYLSERKQFGPSKYIGYKNMTSARYKRGSGKDGRDTEVRLTKWFQKLNARSRQWNILYDQLEDLLVTHDKKPNRRTFIHIRK
jgi:hypothetical protein